MRFKFYASLRPSTPINFGPPGTAAAADTDVGDSTIYQTILAPVGSLMINDTQAAGSTFVRAPIGALNFSEKECRDDERRFIGHWIQCVLFTAENDRVTIQVRLPRRTSPRVATPPAHMRHASRHYGTARNPPCIVSMVLRRNNQNVPSTVPNPVVTQDPSAIRIFFHSQFPNKASYFHRMHRMFRSDWWFDIRLVVCPSPWCRSLCGKYFVDSTMTQASRVIILPSDVNGPWDQRIDMTVNGSIASAHCPRYSIVALYWGDSASTIWNPQTIITTIKFRGMQAAFPFPVGVTTP
ncbi:hypothetical protein EDB85DRAFT_1890919 [Lactarius pseudohatsudake]|nr:hypothetical protein EDB85DRAFT_1890919 [Lactarius pseudohatsudake]